LNELITDFNKLCPDIRIIAERDANNDGLNQRYRESVTAGGGPDLLLDSTEFLATLAANDQIRPISDVIDPTRLTQFVPSTVQAMRHNGLMYGYPEASRSIALIYNPTLIANPPQTLDDLLLQVDLDNQFAMPLTFFYSFWGLGAFGGRLFDEDRQAILDQGGMVEWLQWLRDAAALPGFVFTDARPAAEDLFIEGEAAFLVSGPWSLPRLYANMPKESIAVTMLPAGPRNVASPMLEVEAFMFNPQASDDQVQAGLAFVRFVTSRQSQERLLATGVHVPANVTVDTSADPVISGFRNQTHTAYPAVQDEYWNVVLAEGDGVYHATVLEGADIEQAVAGFNFLVNATNASLKQAEQAR
jgi:maltose-binding protein MalE